MSEVITAIDAAKNPETTIDEIGVDDCSFYGGDSKNQKWSNRVGAALFAAFAVLFIWSSVNTYDVEIAEAVPAGIEEAVEKVLGPSYKLVDASIAYDEIGHQLNLAVVGTEPIPPDLAKAVRLKVSEYCGRASRVRLIARISAEEFQTPLICSRITL